MLYLAQDRFVLPALVSTFSVEIVIDTREFELTDSIETMVCHLS